MELRTLATFIRVAELQNFSRAAEQLGYSQSAVTMQIKQLEGELKVPLFERIGKQVKLTEAGEQFIPYAQEILKTAEEARKIGKKNEHVSGVLRIGTNESLITTILPPILLEYQKTYPEVETVVCLGTSRELQEMMQHNDVDLIYFLAERVYCADWIRVLEHEEPVVFVTRKENPICKKKLLTLDELIAQPLILTEKGRGYRYRLEQLLGLHDIELHPVLEIGNIDVIIHMVLEDMGTAFLPLFTVQEYIERGEMTILHVEDIDIKVYGQMVYHHNKWMTPRLAAFLDFVRKHVPKDYVFMLEENLKKKKKK